VIETIGTLRRKLRMLGTRHPSWCEDFQVREGPLAIQNGYRVTAIDAMGAEFGFGIGSGWPEMSEQIAHELATLLNALHEEIE
jgi:hypothetical protein